MLDKLTRRQAGWIIFACFVGLAGIEYIDYYFKPYPKQVSQEHCDPNQFKLCLTEDNKTMCTCWLTGRGMEEESYLWLEHELKRSRVK